jgi:hypothetical protein
MRGSASQCHGSANHQFHAWARQCHQIRPVFIACATQCHGSANHSATWRHMAPSLG